MATSTLGMNNVSREPVTTQWDDIQRGLGNLPPLETATPASAGEEAEPTPAAEALAAVQASEQRGTRAEEEDAEVARLRAKRLDELKGKSPGEARFGSVKPLEVADYTKEVNEAGDGVPVVVFLSKAKGHYMSSYMLVILEKLARKFGDVKFLNIESTQCIPGYPDSNLPTLLLYRDDDLLGQCVGPAAFGGSSFSIEDVEWELAQAGVLKTDLPANPHGRDREKKR